MCGFIATPHNSLKHQRIKRQERKNILGDRIIIEFQVLSSNPLQSLPFHQNATGMHNIMNRMTKQYIVCQSLSVLFSQKIIASNEISLTSPTVVFIICFPL